MPPRLPPATQPRCTTRSIVQRWLLFCALGALASCAQIGTRNAPIDQVSPLPPHWACEGKIALRTSAADGSVENSLLRYQLEQRGEDYTLKLSGALGFGAVVVERAKGVVSLSRGGEVIEQAHSVDALFRELTGLQLPVSLIRYWITGRPGPKTIAEISRRNATGFEQAGWSVQYPALGEFDGLILPRKLKVIGEPASFTIVVAKWVANWAANQVASEQL